MSSKTLDEQFEEYHADKYGHTSRHRLSVTAERYDVARNAFLAGAAAEREAVLEIIVAVREADIQTNHWQHPITKHLCDEIERRITERGQR